MYPDVTTASPGPRNIQVKLKRLSRPVCTLSENCTTTMFVIVSPYYFKIEKKTEKRFKVSDNKHSKYYTFGALIYFNMLCVCVCFFVVVTKESMNKRTKNNDKK